MNNKKYYIKQSKITHPGKYLFLYSNLPDNIIDLCDIVQNLLLHIHWAERYGRIILDEEKHEEGLRKVERQLELYIRNSSSKTFIQLNREQKILGTCRDFSTLLCSFLRYKGIPARPRCGFAKYFDRTSNYKYDHWVCEYWDSKNNKWLLADAQLDEFQCKELNISFNTTNVPKELFMFAGEAWNFCRKNKDNPLNYGFCSGHEGLWFIKGNLIRDLLSLAKIELLPWDTNELIGEYKKHIIQNKNYQLLDSVANVTTVTNPCFIEIKNLIKNNPILGMPFNWMP